METHLPNKFLHAHWKKSCDFALWDGITWLTSGPISFTESICCYGRSEKPEQSLLSKYFCIIVLHDCVPKQQASSSESNNRIYCVSSACSDHYSQWYLVPPFIRKWRCCCLWLVGWKRCFIRIRFMRYSSFASRGLLYKKNLIIKCTNIGFTFKYLDLCI